VPELVLLSFSRAEFARLHRAAMKGDEAAVQQETVEAWWSCWPCSSFAPRLKPAHLRFPQRKFLICSRIYDAELARH
jgi:hypothetical protein